MLLAESRGFLKGAGCCRCFYRQYQHAVNDENAVPRITVPHQLVQRLEKIKSRQRKNTRKETYNRKASLVISCKRPEFNHRRGQIYSDFNPSMLASSGWKHYKSKGDHFIINPTRGMPAFETDEGIETFADVGVSEAVLAALENMNITKPTNIQAQTIPHLLKGLNVLCAAETGSGKTLAYLLPMIERILRYNHVYGPVTDCNKPRGIIVVPSRELVQQIYNVTQDLGKLLPLNTYSVIGGSGTQKILKYRPSQVMDILIGSPGMLSKCLTNRIFDSSMLQSLVFDEADTLLDDSFSPLTLRLIRKLNVASQSLEELDDQNMVSGTQISFVSATMPRQFDKILGDIVPMDSIVRVTTKHLHRLMPHVPQKFVRIGPDDKAGAFLEHMKRILGKKLPTMVFCNKSDTASFVAKMLEENNIQCIKLTAQMSQEARQGRFAKYQAGESDVLVCTDIASRGLDTVRTQHIVNYEFPGFLSDYIHRVGRVGRVGSEGNGSVFSYIAHKWEVDMLWKIEIAVRRIKHLDNVDANIKRKLGAIFNSKYMNSDE